MNNSQRACAIVILNLCRCLLIRAFKADHHCTDSNQVNTAAEIKEYTLPLLCEGRGSGFTAMLSQLRQAGMSPPQFDITLAHFKLCFWKHTLLHPDILHWVSQIRTGQTISESQRKNLACIYHTKALTNTDYCRVSGVDSRIATRELKQLVDLVILEHANNDRWSQYRLPNNKDNSLQEHLPGLEPNKPNQKTKKRPPLIRAQTF